MTEQTQPVVTIQHETIQNCLEEIKPTLVIHHKELCTYPDKMPLDPDYPKYFSAEKAGTLQLITARVEGELVGYYIGFAAMGLHYKSTPTAVNDIFYIKKDKRLKGIGSLLFAAVRQDCHRRGIKFWRIETKAFAPVQEFMEKEGFDAPGIVHTVWLGD